MFVDELIAHFQSQYGVVGCWSQLCSTCRQTYNVDLNQYLITPNKPAQQRKRRLSSRQLIEQSSKGGKISQPAVVMTNNRSSFSNPSSANLMMDDVDEPMLYKGFWPARGICCCQGASSETNFEESVEMDGATPTSNANDKKAFKIAITDTHITYTTRTKLLPCACCFGGCPQIYTTTSNIDSLNTVIVREDDGAGCCGMFLMYLVWFLFGTFGAHCE